MLTVTADAPALAHDTIRIDAPPELVHAVLADVSAWPRWQRAVSSVDLQGAVALGTTFRWRSGGTRISSTVELLSAPHALGWTGRALGTRAVHVWHLRAAGAGTIVETSESMEGWLIRLLRPVMRRMLAGALATVLAELKAEAERRHAATATVVA